MWWLIGLDWSPISEESASILERQFSKEKIKEVVFHMDKEKAPNLDGFPLAFDQYCWNIIKKDFLKVFFEFHDNI